MLKVNKSCRSPGRTDRHPISHSPNWNEQTNQGYGGSGKHRNWMTSIVIKYVSITVLDEYGTLVPQARKNRHKDFPLFETQFKMKLDHFHQGLNSLSTVNKDTRLLISRGRLSYHPVYKSWKPCNVNQERKLSYLVVSPLKWLSTIIKTFVDCLQRMRARKLLVPRAYLQNLMVSMPIPLLENHGTPKAIPLCGAAIDTPTVTRARERRLRPPR